MKTVDLLERLNDKEQEEKFKRAEISAKKTFLNLIQHEQYVGDVFSLGYESALVVIHDFQRKQVGGIPSLSFLLATRISSDQDPDQFDYTQEDASMILLRVMDAAPLPNDLEALRVRVETAQRVSGDVNSHWDSEKAMDQNTHHLLSFAGVRCRVIGTFYLQGKPDSDDLEERIPVMRFGSDISNYYPNRGLTVFKPNAEALEAIVNFRDKSRPDLLNDAQVTIGEVRYASTNRAFQGVADVSVNISPADLLDQKTALFGMTRTGKSNTTKVMMESVFDLRFAAIEPLRIGQVVFDPNGEYANENVQDENKESNPSAIKNVWQTNPSGNDKDVVTYGITRHPNDPNRRLMLINFYDTAMLQVGKDIIDTLLERDTAKYIQNFRQVGLEPPREQDYEEKQYKGALIRYQRRLLFYRALLNKAGFDVPTSLAPTLWFQGTPLFSKEILGIMEKVQLQKKDSTKQSQIHRAATVLGRSSVTWAALATAAEGLFYFIGTDKYEQFDQNYIKTSSSGESWADGDLIRILEMFTYRKGANVIGEVRNQHTDKTDSDFAQDIYDDLKSGKLVIVDQSSGNPDVNEAAAKRIMQRIFIITQHFT